jgi:DMSO/TMAO reductase YedYZ molybdopterin-dependent catalytic subunit
MTVSAQGFPGWNITIDGLVAQPMNLTIFELFDMMQMEQRVLRHR